jgi:flagellar basal body rod protein FlgG
MAGGYYIALSGMRSRLDELDRLASDIANVNTTGFRAERATTSQADRGDFRDVLQAAIDVGRGPTRIDARPGAVKDTGRDLDVLVDGPGMFVIDTPAGPRYTRDGRFNRRADGVLANQSGMAVQSDSGAPITIGTSGPINIDADGTVRSNGASVGKLKLVEFSDPGALIRVGPDQFSAGAQVPSPAVDSSVKSGSLEQSNVSIVDRMSTLTAVSRSHEAMQKAFSLLSNDIDSRAISELGRRG